MAANNFTGLGSEFCSGYVDSMGKWNNGFYCPGESTEEQFCCGTATFKYCCPQREQRKVVTEQFSSLSLFLGIVFGVIAAIILVTIVSCCVLYKKRQPRLNDGPFYQMHCSSTASGVANMYSFSNPNSMATTPLDTAMTSSHLLVDLEPVVSHSLLPTESQSTIARVHTFSRESCFTDIGDLHEAGSRANYPIPESSGLRSSEPPPTYDSQSSLSARENQPQDTNLHVLSQDITLSQQTFNAAKLSNPSPVSGSHGLAHVITTAQTESQIPACFWTFSSDGVPANTDDLIPNRSVGPTFNSSVSARPTTEISPAPLEPTLLSELRTQSASGHDALYHSTKF